MFGIAVYALRVLARESGRARFVRPSAADMRKLFSLGWPSSLQFMVGMALFVAVATLIGRLGPVPLAAHQIAVTGLSLTWMASAAMAGASASRVGFHVGAGEPAIARRAGLLGIGIAALFGALFSLGFGALPELLPRWIAPDQPEVIALGATLVRILAVFVLLDCIQNTAQGALRGAGDMKGPFYASLLGQWTVGLPLALLLGVKLDRGAPGFWWGLTIGMAVVMLMQLARFAMRMHRPIARM